jgi:hypothetical protein
MIHDALLLHCTRRSCSCSKPALTPPPAHSVTHSVTHSVSDSSDSLIIPPVRALLELQVGGVLVCVQPGGIQTLNDGGTSHHTTSHHRQNKRTIRAQTTNKRSIILINSNHSGNNKNNIKKVTVHHHIHILYTTHEIFSKLPLLS